MEPTYHWCPFCGASAIFLGEEGDGMNEDLHSGYYCKKCDTCYGIRSGMDTTEWCEEVMKGLGIKRPDWEEEDETGI